jgi:hypothetical protein
VRTSPLRKVASAVVTTVMAMVMAMDMTMFMVSMSAGAPVIAVEAVWIPHQDVLVILLSRDVGWNLAGRFFVVYGETKETTWPVAATERTNVLFVFFFWMGLHTNEYASKRSTLRLDKKETSKIIGCANRQNAAKLEKPVRQYRKERGKRR